MQSSAVIPLLKRKLSCSRTSHTRWLQLRNIRKMADGLTQRKRTMIKSRVGCVKTSTYNLPASSHVYGYKQPSDPEGAGACE